MTHELGPEARALLDAAREGLGPDAAAIRRMRAKIDASIASGAAGTGAGSGAGGAGGGGTAAGSGAGTATGAGAGAGALAMKLGALALVAAIAAGALVYSSRRGEQGSEPRVAPPAARVEAPASASAPEVTAAPAAGAAHAEPEIEMPAEARAAPAKQPAPAPPTTMQRQPQAQPQPAPQASQPAPPPASAARRADLAREVELVDRAMGALRRGAPADALAAVRVHAAETAGAGQLAEDAAAIEIEALCRLHDAAVAAKLAAFDARWPQSAQRSRLTARCP